jgi:Mn-containing catalase
MFFHKQELQYKAEPSKPDAVLAHKMQEILGGQYGEITVAMQYGFQAWNSKLPGKYRDMVFGIGAEEFGHVEMIATMIAQLLAKAPVGATEKAVQDDPVIAAVVGGTDIQAAIVAGAGARPVDSNGNPWSGSYITASGNLLADVIANANAEMQGRLQVARLYHMTEDKGVRDMLGFLLARDTADGVEELPIPSNFPMSEEIKTEEYKFYNFSDGAAASEGTWAQGPSPDGKGQFTYEEAPTSGVPFPKPTKPDERLYGTTPVPNIVEKAAGVVKDKLGKS